MAKNPGFAVRLIGRACTNFRFNSAPFLGLHSIRHHKQFSTSSKLLSAHLFTEKHEWVYVEKDNIGKVGISDYAQEKLGDVVYVQLPEPGANLEADSEAGCLESVKAASEIYTPVSGKVTEINKLLDDSPNLINQAPYEEGWLFKLELSKPDELKSLMDIDAYKKFIQGLEE